jgi:PIN domain nuclease of toxin-antitoxin system
MFWTPARQSPFCAGNLEPKKVRTLADSANEIHIHAINLIEIHYRITSFGGEMAADEAVADLSRIGVRVFDALPNHLRSRVSFFKSHYSFLSLADSICIALGEQLKAHVVTSDRPFANVKDGVHMQFIR